MLFLMYVYIYIYLSMGLVDTNYFIMVELIAVVKVENLWYGFQVVAKWYDMNFPMVQFTLIQL